MKSRLFPILLFCLVIFPLSARADHHEVFISQVVRLNAANCAVELEIDAANQNGFEGVDRIQINGTTLASIGDTEAAVIDNGGHVNIGDHILFASNSFQSLSGLNADVGFDDSGCSNFVAGASFTFVIDDPVFGGPNKVIDTLVLPSSFGEDSAAVKASDSSSPTMVNLLTDSVTVSNNAGSTSMIGSSNPNTGGGGCALAGTAPAYGAASLGIFSLLVSLGYAMLRKTAKG